MLRLAAPFCAVVLLSWNAAAQQAPAPSPALENSALVAPGRRRFTVKNIWLDNPGAPRWGMDLLAGLSVGGGYPGWTTKGSARYAILPWVSFGASGAFHAEVEHEGRILQPSQIALGIFTELHMVPGGIIDPWFRYTVGSTLVTGEEEPGWERGTQLFREASVGIAFGRDWFFLGPYLSIGRTLPADSDLASLGLRFDFTTPEGAK